MTAADPPSTSGAAGAESAADAGAEQERAGGTDWDALLDQLTGPPDEGGWLTLDEASAAAGVSRSTLRSWYRAGHVPSRMVLGPHGPQRLVPLSEVLDRALRSSRLRRQLEQGRSLAAEVEELRGRVEVMERMLGLR